VKIAYVGTLTFGLVFFCLTVMLFIDSLYRSPSLWDNVLQCRLWCSY